MIVDQFRNLNNVFQDTFWSGNYYGDDEACSYQIINKNHLKQFFRYIKKLIIICITIIFCGCMQLVLIAFPEVGYDELPIQFDNFEEAWVFTSNYITYKLDNNTDSWQTPIETYKRKIGDCEDFCIFLAYFCNELDIDCKLVAISVNGIGHMILCVEGKYLTPQKYYKFYNKNDLDIHATYTYYEALKLAHYR